LLAWFGKPSRPRSRQPLQAAEGSNPRSQRLGQIAPFGVESIQPFCGRLGLTAQGGLVHCEKTPLLDHQLPGHQDVRHCRSNFAVDELTRSISQGHIDGIPKIQQNQVGRIARRNAAQTFTPAQGMRTARSSHRQCLGGSHPRGFVRSHDA
jgi:hypothetical protein